MREDVTGAFHFTEVRFWARLLSFSFCEYDFKDGFQTGRNTDVMMPVNMDPKAQLRKLETVYLQSRFKRKGPGTSKGQIFLADCEDGRRQARGVQR